MNVFPSDRYLRLARRAADVSQRELAARAGLPRHVVAAIERDPRCARVAEFAVLLGAAGLRLAVIDAEGREVQPAEVNAGRTDRAGRRFPAHLDVRPGGPSWWAYYWPSFTERVPEFTFDRDRSRRDFRRSRRSDLERTSPDDGR